VNERKSEPCERYLAECLFFVCYHEDMRKVKNIILIMLKRTKRFSKRQAVNKQSIHHDIPYFAQWESPELIEKILTNKISAQDDPNWTNSGAKTKKEYELWSAIGCGMACTKMIIAYRNHRTIPLVKLGSTCLSYGGYTEPLEESAGLIYKPFVRFLKVEYGLTAESVLPLLFEEIIDELSNGNLIIASVSPHIRHQNSTLTTGGHLVLVHGYDLEKKSLFFHNPSGFIPEMQSNVVISFADFKKFYANRGVIVY